MGICIATYIFIYMYKACMHMRVQVYKGGRLWTYYLTFQAEQKQPFYLKNFSKFAFSKHCIHLTTSLQIFHFPTEPLNTLQECQVWSWHLCLTAEL